MAKNILDQEKLSAKVFSSPINRYPLFSVPAEWKGHTVPQLIALQQVNSVVAGRDLTCVALSRDGREECLSVKC